MFDEAAISNGLGNAFYARQGMAVVDLNAPKVEVKPARVVSRDFLYITRFDAQSMVQPGANGATIMRIVLKVTDVEYNDFVSIRRKIKCVRARQIFAAIAREYTSLSLPQIGRMMGDRDHSTVMHGITRVEAKPAYFEPELSIARNLVATVLSTEKVAG